MEQRNPFIFREIPVDAPFCNRQKELKDLVGYAQSRTHVVIYSPRRFGKTSLVKRVQKKMRDQGTLTPFVDFFGVSTADDVALRLTKALFEVIRSREGWFKKAIGLIKSLRPVLRPDELGNLSLTVEPGSPYRKGIEVIEEVLETLDRLTQDKKLKLHLVFDEFQEISELKESLAIEGLLRSHIQKQPASYFFVGSRRRILLEIFNTRKRPFFQSALNYEIKRLPHQELVSFLVDQFRQGEKQCPPAVAETISGTVFQHPYYAQKLSFFIFEISDKKVEPSHISPAVDLLLAGERPVYEAILQGLAPQQILLLRSLASEPTRSLFSLDYLRKHNLGSTGGMQGALARLGLLDLIEKDDSGSWRVVDPFFGLWLKGSL